MEEEYREIELYETQLRVYRNGDIWRLCKGNSKGCKKGDWKLVKVVVNSGGRFQVCLNKKNVLVHRIIALVYLGLDVDDLSVDIDHKNRIRTDNRLENLRILPHLQNMWNTGAKGYSFNKRAGKYKAQITVNKKMIHLGYHDTEEEASNAYQSAKLLYHIL